MMLLHVVLFFGSVPRGNNDLVADMRDCDFPAAGEATILQSFPAETDFREDHSLVRTLEVFGIYFEAPGLFVFSFIGTHGSINQLQNIQIML